MISEEYLKKLNNSDRIYLKGRYYNTDHDIKMVARLLNFGNLRYSAKILRNNPYNLRMIEIINKLGLLKQLE